jgi:DNA-binding CsgD family transcriptional regulator
MGCPYESALALRDAGDLQWAYRALRALGATRAREAVAWRLRAADQPIPRGPGASAGSPPLTDTERAVCRLVAGGATNAAVATELNIGVRTVGAHLSRIYEKTGRRGRAAPASGGRNGGCGARGTATPPSRRCS